MKIWKRNAVVSCIVLFVCVALYLSWSYGRNKEEPEVFNPDSGFDPAVMQSDGQPQGPLDVQGPDVTDYFTETRLARMQARDSALSILNQAAENTDASQVILDNVATEIEKLSKNAMSEANIEAMVKAKGYDECVAFINKDGITVVVSEPIGGLTETDVLVIKDVILRETDLTVADITLEPREIAS
ncbi:MAG: SpoIIIAH-like family protein [Oscillospiraceae bacterium]|jgi:stage III sporulation protein AH|nr:SpoIIIAH-like family protein [Oscillospiraceae bacterium]